MVQEASASQIPHAAGKPSAGSGSSCGIFALRWSHDGRFIASSAMESSRVLWVWDMTSLVCVAQLQNLAAFVDFQWCPRTNQLAAACGSRTVYVWTEEGQLRVEAFCYCLFVFLVFELRLRRQRAPVLNEWLRSFPSGASCVHVPLESFFPAKLGWSK